MTESLKTAQLFHKARKLNCQLPNEKFGDADIDGLIAGAEFIEGIFPSWVIVLCKVHHAEVRYVSKNSKHILHFEAPVLKGYSPEEFFSLIHPDDKEATRKCYQRMCEEMDKKEYKPADHKFAFHYRIQIPDGRYIHIIDEKNVFLNKSGLYLHFSLLKRGEPINAASAAYMDIFVRNQLEFHLQRRFVPNALQETITKREREIIQLLKKGMTNKRIAEKLFISVNTVRNHRNNLMRKMRCSNAVELINFAETMSL